jgi:hypothetical protein
MIESVDFVFLGQDAVAELGVQLYAFSDLALELVLLLVQLVETPDHLIATGAHLANRSLLVLDLRSQSGVGLGSLGDGVPELPIFAVFGLDGGLHFRDGLLVGGDGLVRFGDVVENLASAV